MMPDHHHLHPVELVEQAVERFSDVTWRRWLMVYICPASILFALEETANYSQVPLNLWVISGPAAWTVVWVYAALVVAAMAFRSHPMLHHVGIALAVLTFGGRAAGFFELAWRADAEHLRGAVAERLLILVLVVFWHVLMSWHTAGKRARGGRLKGACNAGNGRGDP